MKVRKTKTGFDKQYYDLQRHWIQKIVPHLKNESLNWILVRDFNKLTMGMWGRPFRPGDLPEKIESVDWKYHHHGRRPRYWSYVKHGSCHWIANFALRLAELAEPHQEWRIVSSREHSTVWDGRKTLFEFNFLALGVPVTRAWQLAAKGKGSRVLPIGQEMNVPFARHFSRQIVVSGRI